MKKRQISQTTTIGGAVVILIVLFCLIVVMPKTQAPDPNKIVLMGDSITSSWSGYSPEFFLNNPYLINKGVSGETTPQMLNRFEADVLNLAPEAVIILAGINDIAQNTGYISVSETFANIINMAEIANSHDITPVLCSVLPAYKIAWRPEIMSADLVVELNDKLKNYCTENNTIYVDYFSSMVGEKKELRPELTYDGIHPDKNGYTIMEGVLLDLLKKIL
tara:strand:- start:205 stop:864 length:660 start_codon:yes stop_codon:yes gene_type:complete